MTIPDNIEAEGRWPLDHLFIDQDGIPPQPSKSGGAGRIRTLDIWVSPLQKLLISSRIS
jgi:hypothetical protein